MYFERTLGLVFWSKFFKKWTTKVQANLFPSLHPRLKNPKQQKFISSFFWQQSINRSVWDRRWQSSVQRPLLETQSGRFVKVPWVNDIFLGPFFGLLSIYCILYWLAFVHKNRVLCQTFVRQVYSYLCSFLSGLFRGCWVRWERPDLRQKFWLRTNKSIEVKSV